MMYSTGARIGFFTGNVRKITEDLKALRSGDLHLVSYMYLEDSVEDLRFQMH
jgi:hypothetical protein